MGCGCAKSERQDRRPAVSLTIIHERAAMCHVCSSAEHGASFWRDGATRCGITGKTIMEHVTSSPCPRGKHPDGTGRTTWAGVRWVGVPYPIRLALWAVGRQHYRPSAFPGCGCIARIKALFA